MKKKKQRIIVNLGIALLTVTALVMFFVTLSHAIIAPPPEPEAGAPSGFQVASTTAISSNSVPDRLIIPTLNINANVQKVGISIHGTMAVPNNYTDVGWYRYGPIPGHAGNAVIAGHLDNGLGLAGVFKNLNAINVGDDVYIMAHDGTKLHFVVTSKDAYDFNTDNTAPIFNGTGNSELKLITCEGTWDQAHKTYTNRLVVTAMFVGST